MDRKILVGIALLSLAPAAAAFAADESTPILDCSTFALLTGTLPEGGIGVSRAADLDTLNARHLNDYGTTIEEAHLRKYGRPFDINTFCKAQPAKPVAIELPPVRPLNLVSPAVWASAGARVSSGDNGGFKPGNTDLNYSAGAMNISRDRKFGAHVNLGFASTDKAGGGGQTQQVREGRLEVFRRAGDNTWSDQLTDSVYLRASVDRPMGIDQEVALGVARTIFRADQPDRQVPGARAQDLVPAKGSASKTVVAGELRKRKLVGADDAPLRAVLDVRGIGQFCMDVGGQFNDVLVCPGLELGVVFAKGESGLHGRAGITAALGAQGASFTEAGPVAPKYVSVKLDAGASAASKGENGPGTDVLDGRDVKLTITVAR